MAEILSEKRFTPKHCSENKFFWTGACRPGPEGGGVAGLRIRPMLPAWNQGGKRESGTSLTGTGYRVRWEGCREWDGGRCPPAMCWPALWYPNPEISALITVLTPRVGGWVYQNFPPSFCGL